MQMCFSENGPLTVVCCWWTLVELLALFPSSGSVTSSVAAAYVNNRWLHAVWGGS